MENQYNKTKENLLLLMQQLNDKANELEGIAPNEEIRRIKYNILDNKLILQNYFDDNSQIKIACKIADKYMKKCFDKFGKEFGIKDQIVPGKSVMFAYIAISVADMLIGLVSHWLKSRKKALYIFYAITIVGIVVYFQQYNGSAANMYLICALMGFGTGFWALFVTMAAEHFGTNLRATAATTAPNMVRGSLPLMIILFKALQPRYSFIQAAEITGLIVMAISTISVFMTEETFGKDLNFIEE